MRISYVSVLAGLLTLMAPLAATAKTNHDDGSKSRKHSVSRHAGSDEGSGTSRSCLTSGARDLLNRIENKFGRVEIVSTCRAGARIASTGKPSRHASGNAIDFRAPGKKKQVVQWLINTHDDGGTMTYSDMDHIHVDVGSHFVALNRPSGH